MDPLYFFSKPYSHRLRTSIVDICSMMSTVEAKRTLVYVLVPISPPSLNASVCLTFPYHPSFLPSNHQTTHVVSFPFGEGWLFGRAACTRLHTCPALCPPACKTATTTCNNHLASHHIQPGSTIPSVLQTNPCLPPKAPLVRKKAKKRRHHHATKDCRYPI